MKGAVILATTLLVGLLTLYSLTGEPTMAPEKCTKELRIACAVEVEKTVKACAKAFETEGADIVADIKCVKDLLADKKLCWPCICDAAKEEGWHVVGC